MFCRAHYLPVFARLGPYPRELLDTLDRAHRPRPGRGRELFEYWAHEASLSRSRLQPLLRWRMARACTPTPGAPCGASPGTTPRLLDDVLAAGRASSGPIRAGRTPASRGRRHGPGQMWNWHDGKIALEYLFYAGRVTAARRVNFERLYDLHRAGAAGRRCSPRRRPVEPTRSASWSGSRRGRSASATEPDLRDYFRLPPAASKARGRRAGRAGELVPVDGRRVGARRPTCGTRARRPRRIAARALLSPFDSLMWFRERTERLFGFRYRIEIYTPAAKRGTATTCCRSCSARRWSPGST